MALNLNMIGKEIGPIQFTYDEKNVILYSLGIGAGVEELDYVYEKNLKVYPTFAVIPTSPAVQEIIAKAGLNMTYVVHGEEKIIMNEVIPPKGSLHTTAVWTSVYDKGNNGAVITIDTQTKDDNGRTIFGTQMVLMDRSAGNFGGDRGPKAEKVEPPEEVPPDFHVEQQTSVNQGAIYRISGDINPLHIDPEFAKKVGFPRPILHGLCSFGFAGRALINTVGQGKVDGVKSFGARFAGVAFPGETLITEGWRIGNGLYTVQTKTGDGRLVLSNGQAIMR